MSNLPIDVEFLVQSIISMVVITSPTDPVKILFFNQAIEDPPRNRTWAAGRVALYAALILVGETKTNLMYGIAVGTGF